MPLHITRLEDEDEESGIIVGKYIGLFHGWKCPVCDYHNYTEEEDDPREIGEILECDGPNCDWSGRVQG